MERYNNIVLNIPHSSTFIPVNTWKGDIEKEIEKWTDIYTDVIFHPNLEERVTPVVFPYSRFYCDAERLPDNEEPMEKIGQGFFYTSFNGCTREKDEYIVESVKNLYNSHRLLLSSCIKFDDTLLIDCHSFPTETAPDIDICIGWNDDSSKPSDELLKQVKKYFEDFGFKVGLNDPYSNSITPFSPFKYHSFMIELNKRLYLDKNGKKLGSMYKLNQCLHYLYKNILDKWSY